MNHQQYFAWFFLQRFFLVQKYMRFIDSLLGFQLLLAFLLKRASVLLGQWLKALPDTLRMRAVHGHWSHQSQMKTNLAANVSQQSYQPTYQGSWTNYCHIQVISVKTSPLTSPRFIHNAADPSTDFPRFIKRSIHLKQSKLVIPPPQKKKTACNDAFLVWSYWTHRRNLK